MDSFSDMTKTFVLSESEALELLAFLFASARTQLDDPALYTSMRLITAAEILRDFVRERVSLETRDLLDQTEEITTHAQINMYDIEDYTSTLDSLCGILAKYVVQKSGLMEQEE
jgi:hypothetical protein